MIHKCVSLHLLVPNKCLYLALQGYVGDGHDPYLSRRPDRHARDERMPAADTGRYPGSRSVQVCFCSAVACDICAANVLMHVCQLHLLS